MGRHSKKASDLWKGQQWKKLRQNLFRLQRRLYKAVQAGNLRKARSLQKLIMKSRSAQLLAIRQVTQLNKGKKTPGIDGKSSLTYRQRLELLELLNQYGSDWKHTGLREVPIAKKNGKTRMLKIPTIADRAWQCLVKYALEPAHEATFHARSYGFRTGRSAHDAQKHVFNNLNSSCNGITKRVIELDIKKCFDRISHSSIMDRLLAPASIKQGIFRCLKAGVSPEFTEQGTPQGGVVSPLLANVALNGIESLHQSIRYADDMVIFLKPNEDAQKVLKKVKEFLTERGMEISEEKTKITHSTDGFDFLGWNFRVQKNGKFRSIPSAENLRTIKKKIKAVANSSNYGAKIKAEKLAPIIRGWRNYHRNCKMDGSRNSLWFTAKRTEEKFRKEKKINRYESERLVKKAFPAVKYKENKHIKVRGTKSPYDGDLVYWSQRNSGLYDNATSKALKKQNHCCGHCGHKLIGNESVHLHHLDGNHDNWKPKNLMAVHQSCHQYIHSSQKDT
ncbi:MULTISPECIES: reverse transcriptase domain-containing protein [Moorena]|uniref:Retron-type reverse transcriptase n=1 Tax=Moorena producens 3L TaxID=489825 RepID=F4XWW3_9CYAN|nr:MULTISPECIES: reverse transcriptase domain-containing protein [Moorena]NEQ13052.1 RNA-dependent DNA polymerase [Moorena sp. SIO3E2]NES83593.1 RNA-dependent DNA polymerase [Moorena sp. SIO2B7]EGJ30848.1 retron-type reverse transcriptase [Moorena producens 3L]NEP37210.1 RNA-dependent DNA polymerase [Moorena sp. SIO3B2]NEP70319.1 RNA-dependent DNA polymerase [Moorena sp. SIO3A5]